MPKKRIKHSGNISKSGTLTQNFRKELKVDSHLNNFVLRDVFHSQNKKNLDNIVFDDSKTIVFNSKVVNATLGIEKSYIEGDYLENNKLVNTPNILDHDSTYEVTKIVRPEDYSHVLYSNYKNELNNDRHVPFIEDFIDYENISSENFEDLVDQTTSFEEIGYNFKKKVHEIKRNFEEINIDFNKKFMYMSFNKNTGSSIGDSYVKFPNFGPWSTPECCFYTGTNNTLYLDKSENNKIRFLGKADTRFANAESEVDSAQFKDKYITHNPLTIYPDDVVIGNFPQKLMSGKSISNPISDFGFPYSKQYEGKNEVLVPASDFINEEFILEKVYVEFKLQNFAISNDANIPCFNTLNFFILNQKDKINTVNQQYNDILSSDNLNKIYYYKESPGHFSNVSRADNFNNRVIYRSNIAFDRPMQESEYLYTPGGGPDTNNSGWDIEREEVGQLLGFNNANQDTNSSRELITSIKIANIGHKIYTNNEVFYQTDGFDAIIQSDIPLGAMTTWDGNDVHDNCINNEFKTVKITKTINSYNENNALKRFSKFNVYPNQRKKRSGMDIKSERSWIDNNVIHSDLSGVGRTDKYSQVFDSGAENEISNPYVLKPKDNLIFGFNFAPSMLLNSNAKSVDKYTDLTGRDVVVLDLSNLKIKLLGRYISEGEIFKPKLKEFENKNIKKINEFATNVVDKTGLPRPYALKGTYYDSYVNDPSYYPNGISSGERGFNNFLNIPVDPDIEFPWGWHAASSTQHPHDPLNPDMWHYPNYTNYFEDTISDSVRTDFRLADKPFVRLLNGNKLEFDKYLYYRYNVDHFGFINDKVNHNTHYAYVENETGKTTFNTTKYFRLKGFYIQKDPVSNPPGNAVGEEHKINSFNKDIHSRVTDSLFKEA